MFSEKFKEQLKRTRPDKAGIKRGDYIQPSDKDAFIKRYGWHPDEDSRGISSYLKHKDLSKSWRPDNPNNPDYKKQPLPLEATKE